MKSRDKTEQRPKWEISQIINNNCPQNTDIDYTFLICQLCQGLLLTPLMCESCKTICCNSCFIKYLSQFWTCPEKCEKISLICVPDELINLFKELSIKCNVCNAIVPYSTYLDHDLESHIKRCFNCNETGVSKQNIHIDYAIARKNDQNMFTINRIKDPGWDKKATCFHIFLKSNRYKGFVTVNESEWLEWSLYRREASTFSFKYISEKQYLNVYTRNNVWKLVGPDYLQGVGVYKDFWSGSIDYDIEKEEIISNSGQTAGHSLVVRIIDKKLFFCKDDDIYQKCKAYLILLDE